MQILHALPVHTSVQADAASLGSDTGRGRAMALRGSAWSAVALRLFPELGGIHLEIR